MDKLLNAVRIDEGDRIAVLDTLEGLESYLVHLCTRIGVGMNDDDAIYCNGWGCSALDVLSLARVFGCALEPPYYTDFAIADVRKRGFYSQGRYFTYYADASALPGNVLDDSGAGVYYYADPAAREDAFCAFVCEDDSGTGFWCAEYYDNSPDVLGMTAQASGFDTPMEAADALDFARN